MSRLLFAGLFRLKKDKVFLSLLAAMVLFGLCRIGVSYMQYQEDGSLPMLDQLFFGYTVFIGILSAAFLCMFIGTSYSDGGLRNQLIVGHGRRQVYLSNLMLSIGGSWLLCLGYGLPICAIGIPLFGNFQLEPLPFFQALLGSLLMTAAFCSLICCLAMNQSNKALSVIIAILGLMVLLYISALMDAQLTAEPYIPGMIGNVDGGYTFSTIENPRYIEGIKRIIYQFIHDLLPTGQSIQYAQLRFLHPWQMMLYSVLVSLGATGVGLLLFKKKDIK